MYDLSALGRIHLIFLLCNGPGIPQNIGSLLHKIYLAESSGELMSQQQTRYGACASNHVDL